jgi:predicted Zn-dependent protease with MMP-like domain
VDFFVSSRASRRQRTTGTVRDVMDPVSREQFEALVADALDSIPPELAVSMENVVVVVEDWPTPEQLGPHLHGPHSGGHAGTLLGLYQGVPLTRRGPMSYAGAMPDRITVFLGPLCARAGDATELAAQVRVTVLHEVGHYFGMDDARLRELGWA